MVQYKQNEFKFALWKARDYPALLTGNSRKIMQCIYLTYYKEDVKIV